MCRTLTTAGYQQYQPRSSNAQKAQSNWEKKSQYLLTEIVKYESYIDSLQAAMSLRLKKRGEKALEKELERLVGANWQVRVHMIPTICCLSLCNVTGH